MKGYVCIVKPPDDHPGAVRVFGRWLDRARADEFCARVVEAVDLDNVEDETTGYAYVKSVEAPSLRKAKDWAVRGER